MDLVLGRDRAGVSGEGVRLAGLGVRDGRLLFDVVRLDPDTLREPDQFLNRVP